MTTNPKAARYHTRPSDRAADRPAKSPADRAVASEEPASAGLFDTQEDGFGNLDFRRDPDPAQPAAPALEAAAPPGAADAGAQPPARKAETPEEIEAALAAIAAEGLTSRQLRRALLIAQKHAITPKSEYDAVRLLREAGIDPFSRASMLRIVSSQPEPGPAIPEAGPSLPREAGRELARLPGDTVMLPNRARPVAVPSTEQRAEVNQAAEILRMQQDIARRRRRRLALLAARMFAFVFMPTFIAGWYFYLVATPMFSVRSEFVIQQAGPASSGGSLGGLFSGTAFATSQDSIAVQGYLQSREAMGRLDEDLGFRAHFQSEDIDSLQRLAPDATLEAAYKVYKKFLKISFDTT